MPPEMAATSMEPPSLSTKRKTEDGGKAELVRSGIISNNFYSFRQGDTHRLETQDENNHGHRGRAMGRHGGYRENDAKNQI